MKKANLILFLIIFVNSVCAQTTIASEVFENSSSLFVITGTGNAFFSGTLASPGLPANANYAAQGSFGLAGTNGSVTLTSGTINSAAYASIQLSLRVAAFSVTATAGLDQTDRVRVIISANGGGSFSDIVTVTGSPTVTGGNSYWAYSATGIATTAYPTAIVANATTTGFNADGYSTITITNIPAVADLRVNIVLTSNANERWVIDDFKITGVSTLPVTLISFNGNLQNNDGLLEWEIATPEDGGSYEIQRSSNGRDFITINTQTGNAVKTKFKFTDAAMNNDKRYYRLKMTDNSRKITYSHIISLSGNRLGASIVYPNPVKDKTTLQINDRSLTGTTARLINIYGSAVHTYTIRNNFEIIDMSTLASGFYMLQLVNGDVIKLLKK